MTYLNQGDEEAAAQMVLQNRLLGPLPYPKQIYVIDVDPWTQCASFRFKGDTTKYWTTSAALVFPKRTD